MSVDRARVRSLVRAELEKRLKGRERPTAQPRAHAALLEIYQGPECDEDPDVSTRPPCVIEPDHPCTNTGYCKKLGH